jgi:hypothetical protein
MSRVFPETTNLSGRFFMFPKPLAATLPADIAASLPKMDFGFGIYGPLLLIGGQEQCEAWFSRETTGEAMARRQRWCGNFFQLLERFFVLHSLLCLADF